MVELGLCHFDDDSYHFDTGGEDDLFPDLAAGDGSLSATTTFLPAADTDLYFSEPGDENLCKTLSDPTLLPLEAAMVERSSQLPEGAEDQIAPNYIFFQIMGKDKPGQVRMMDKGVCPTDRLL
ncbi:uncharacterized protein LOC125193860 [Salvia hispanica]|uniref:uncharacterized protein LOC125193860 n=1 Tax=Salvia hispanica TaxID=49212 RepID=UPI00200908B8|nr:uncharacterized protein LOC125193860 [Salvia hispanica]